ncbi:hypothetical protein BJX70DRAFT_93994 [Aspergillus crustosus]
MCPDINSLPPSRSTSASPRQRRNPPSLLDTLSPTIPTQTLSSTGASNTILPSMSNNHTNGSNMTPELPRRHHPIAVSERRRSGNLNLSSSNNSYDSGTGELPSPSDHRSSISHGLRTASPSNLGGSPIIGTGDPHHQRAPSLGELHQELEQEQEAQVNRLLQTIRTQQVRLQHLEQQHQQSAIDDVTPSSERSTSFPPAAALSNAGSRTSTQLPSSLSSRRPSQAHSPSLRPTESLLPDTLEWIPGPGEGAGRRGSRGESSFYQAEATTLARENQMLRLRVRELERQVSELSTNASTRGLSVHPAPFSQGLTVPTTGGSQVVTGAGSDGELSDKT